MSFSLHLHQEIENSFLSDHFRNYHIPKIYFLGDWKRFSNERVNKYFIQNELQLVAIARADSSQFCSPWKKKRFSNSKLFKIQEFSLFTFDPRPSEEVPSSFCLLQELKDDDDLYCCSLATLLLSCCNDLDLHRIHDSGLLMELLDKEEELLGLAERNLELADIAEKL